MRCAEEKTDSIGAQAKADGLAFHEAAIGRALQAKRPRNQLLAAAHLETALLRVAEHFNPCGVGMQKRIRLGEDVAPGGKLANRKKLPFALDTGDRLPNPLGVAGIADLIWAMHEAGGVGLEDRHAPDGFEEGVPRKKVANGGRVRTGLESRRPLKPVARLPLRRSKAFRYAAGASFEQQSGNLHALRLALNASIRLQLDHSLAHLQFGEGRLGNELRQRPAGPLVLHSRRHRRVGISPIRFQLTKERGNHLHQQRPRFVPKEIVQKAPGGILAEAAGKAEELLQVALKLFPNVALIKESSKQITSAGLR